MYHHRSLRQVGSALAVAIAFACGGGTEPEDPDPVLATVSGSGQSGDVGEPLSAPLVVRVTQGTQAVVGTTVSWTVTAGGGSVDPASAPTDGTGTASTTWTLGASPGANTVAASAAGVTGSPRTFTATGEDDAPPPTQAAVSVGDNFFNPTSQTVAVGGTVTWTWAGQIDHNVTFTSGTNSVSQSTGTFARDFPTAGTFAYLCTIHGGAMSGSISVE